MYGIGSFGQASLAAWEARHRLVGTHVATVALSKLRPVSLDDLLLVESIPCSLFCSDQSRLHSCSPGDGLVEQASTTCV